MKNYTDLLGTKFKVHGRNKQEGFDCYGLAMEVLSRNNIFLPEIPYEDFETSENIRDSIFNQTQYIKITKPEINCIIEIEYKGLPMHVAIYIGEGKMIHSVIGHGVMIEPIRLWQKRIKGYYKVCNTKSV